MINTTSESAIRACLKNCLRELAVIEACLERELQNFSMHDNSNTLEYESSSTAAIKNDDGSEMSVAQDAIPFKPLNPTLAKEKEKEIEKDDPLKK